MRALRRFAAVRRKKTKMPQRDIEKRNRRVLQEREVFRKKMVARNIKFIKKIRRLEKKLPFPVLLSTREQLKIFELEKTPNRVLQKYYRSLRLLKRQEKSISKFSTD